MSSPQKRRKKSPFIQFANCLDVITITIMKMHIFNGLPRNQHRTDI